MILPADHITIDGTTAWLVFGGAPVLGNTLQYGTDRPCDTCGGRGRCDIYNDGKVRCGWQYCTDCDGTGRHCFTIDVEDDPIPSMSQLLGDEDPPKVTRQTLSVHVVPGMVLPIVSGACPAKTNEQQHNHIHLPSEGEAGICWFDADLVWDSPWHSENRITLPPAAEPGMWAVHLEIHQ